MQIVPSGLLLQDCPFIVCMTYAFHTPDKLCFILDLMNGMAWSESLPPPHTRTSRPQSLCPGRPAHRHHHHHRWPQAHTPDIPPWRDWQKHQDSLLTSPINHLCSRALGGAEGFIVVLDKNITCFMGDFIFVSVACRPANQRHASDREGLLDD